MDLQKLLCMTNSENCMRRTGWSPALLSFPALPGNMALKAALFLLTRLRLSVPSLLLLPFPGWICSLSRGLYCYIICSPALQRFFSICEVLFWLSQDGKLALVELRGFNLMPRKPSPSCNSFMDFMGRCFQLSFKLVHRALCEGTNVESFTYHTNFVHKFWFLP